MINQEAMNIPNALSVTRLFGVLVLFVFIGSFYIDTTRLIRLIRLIIPMYSVSFIESIAVFLKYGYADPDKRTLFQLSREKTTLSK